MTSTEFIPVETAVERYGISKEKILNKVLQQTIRMENCDGYVGISVDDLDAEYVNAKAKHNSTVQVPVSDTPVAQTGDTPRRFTTWTRKEIATLKKYWGTEDPEITAARVGRTVSGCDTKWGALRRKGKIRVVTEKEPGSRRRSPGVSIAPGTYSTAEFAEAIGKDERFVRYLCADKIVRAEKKPLSTKMGKRAATWVIYTPPSEYLAEPKKPNAHHKQKGDATGEGPFDPVAETPARPRGGLLARVASACAIFKRGRA